MPFAPTAEVSRRRRALFIAALALACLVSLLGFADIALQRTWLAGVWLEQLAPRLWVLALAVCASCVAFARGWRAARSRAPIPSTARLVRWALIAAVGGWLFALEPGQIALRPASIVAAAAGAGLWSACVALARFDDASRRRWERAVEFIAFQAAACVLGGELTLRAVRAAAHPRILATACADPDVWLRERLQVPGELRYGFPINSDGFVDRELPEDPPPARLVACIGDSFSVGSVPHARHYTTVAERRFDGLEVYNIGVICCGPREYLRMLERYALPARPELIVVALFLGNDIDEARHAPPSWLRSLLDSQEVLIVQLPGRVRALLAERRAGTMMADARERGAAPSRSADEFLRRELWLDDPLQEPLAMTREHFLYLERVRAECTTDPRRSDFGALFESLDDLRRAAGAVPLAFLLFPDEFQVEDELWTSVSGHGELVRDLPQQRIGAWLTERQLLFIDLLPRLRAIEPLSDGARHVYHLQDTHFNSRGNLVAGEALAELIERCSVARRNEIDANGAQR